GVGAFLACGRVGCLMVGCCHGRPYAWGVRYRGEHADAGFAAHLVGVRLFPVQLVESAWVAATVAVGMAMVFAGAPPGAALAWYVVAYDVGRFLFEFARGDVDRPYHAGFSQAQWLSLVLTLGVGAAELAGLLPLAPWHLAAGPALALAMAAVALRRRRDGARRFRLLHPRHLDELARLLAAPPPAAAGAVPIARTSLGIRLSTGRADGVRHHTLSADGGLTEGDAGALAAALARLRGASPASARVVPGAGGIYHVLLG
ncbi:MAG TPA: prolipoprotein diacylglyceryl transferase family protein, partial [Longimicrobium sp.]|nr:prolipoprotein diacylglyceryl transferase family protein [Longimicrobium sp.]